MPEETVTEKLDLPDRLKAAPMELEDPQIATDLTISRTYDAQQISSLQSLGLIRIDGTRFQSLSQLGDAARSLGLMRLQHGAWMVSLENVLQSLGWAGRVVAGEAFEDGTIPTPKQKMEAAQLVGYLGGQLAKVNGSAIKSEQTRVETAIAADRQRRSSFAPGMAIPVQATVKPG